MPDVPEPGAATAFCDFYRESHGHAPTVAELVCAVGFPAAILLKQLLRRGQVATRPPQPPAGPWK
jgi:hypothetical protein